MDVSQYAELFQAEAEEYMQVLNQCLLNLEKNPKDTEELQEAFRVAHSLKGMAGTMGYQHVCNIAHGLENFMEDFKTLEREPGPEVIDLIFEAVDVLQEALEQPDKSTEGDRQKWEQLLIKMKKVRDKVCDNEDLGSPCKHDNAGIGEDELLLGAMDKEILRQAEEGGNSPYIVNISLNEDALMKSVRVHMIFKAMEEFAEIVISDPSRQELEEERFERSFRVVLVLEAGTPEGLKEALEHITDVERVEINLWGTGENDGAASAGPLSEAESEAVKAEDDTGKDKVSEEGTGVYKEQPEKENQEVKNTTPENEVSEKAPSGDQGQGSRAADKMVRGETQKLDDLVNLVGEMVVARTRITEIGHGFNEDLDSTIDQLKRSITNLQDTAMELRMVPIDQVFGRFPRMVRDLCREKGKKVQLYISGEETELDRSIINRLSDPLVHLLRNAFDHGVESPEVRKDKGKNPEGSIYLNARHEGNQVVITVEDDGSGIDPQKIGSMAVEKGVITEDEMNQLSKDDLISLIFFSGFSTSDEITDVSGRGVGMDAVRNSIEALHGTVEVSSEINVMTRFEIRLPLTLAIITTLLVKSNGQLYAIPVEVINENVYLDSKEIKTIRGNPVVNLRGEVIPLYTLSSLLGFEHTQVNDEECSVVIVEAANRKAGFIVDELVGQQEIMIKSLGSFLKGLKGIAGATVLGDGSVTLIIDVAGLLSEGRDYVEQNSFSG